MYANPEDFIKTPPHMPPRKNEGGEDQREVPKPPTDNDEVPVSHNYLLVCVAHVLMSVYVPLGVGIVVA